MPSESADSEMPPQPCRDQLRLDRQARVGILRNPKEPPPLPLRKAALTGRWVDLRSRRRLRRQGIDLPPLAAMPHAASAPPHLPAGDGQGARIDIDRLMTEMDGRASTRPARQPFAHGFRGGAEDMVAARLRQSLRELSEAATPESLAAPPIAGASAAAMPEPDTGDAAASRSASPSVAPVGRGRRFAVGMLAGLALASFVALVASLAMPHLP